MSQLSAQGIHPSQQAGNKEEAIRWVAAALVSAGNVADGYVSGILAHEQRASTFLGNGITTPHSTTDTYDQVPKTGVQVSQLPQGVTWGEGRAVHVTIGTVASSDEHLGPLRQLTYVLSNDTVAAQLQSVTTAEELHALLMGERQSEALKLDNETLSLGVTTSDLLILQALNTMRLKEVGAANTIFASHTINDTPLSLGQNVWLNDSAEDGLRGTVAVGRAANVLARDDQPVSLLVTVMMADEQSTAVLSRLSKLLLDKGADRLLKASVAIMLMLLTSDDAIVEDVLSAESVVRNEHSLHVRLGTMLINTIKQFSSDITVTNFDGSGRPANGHSLMKVVVLGTKKGHRLCLTAQGRDVQQALGTIGEAIAADLGEDA